MTLLFKQRMFSWFEGFDVFDEAGQTVYTVKGKPALGHKLMVHDAGGAVVAELREELLHMTPHFRFIVGGQELGIMKGKLALLHPEFVLDFNDWLVKGNFTQWDYQVTNKLGSNIMTVQKKLWHLTDTYNMDIEDPANALLCLLIVLGIDAAKCDEARANTAMNAGHQG